MMRLTLPETPARDPCQKPTERICFRWHHTNALYFLSSLAIEEDHVSDTFALHCTCASHLELFVWAKDKIIVANTCKITDRA